MKRKRDAMTKSNSKKGNTKRLKLQERMNLEAPDKEFIINEVVLAVVPGYSAWPARILEISGVTIKVEFFGTGEMCVAFGWPKFIMFVIFFPVRFFEN